VVDHDTGRLVWAAPGRDRKTLNAFFAALGESRCAAITHVSADAAPWIADEVALNCPNAVRCATFSNTTGHAPSRASRSAWV
jgi:transposase